MARRVPVDLHVHTALSPCGGAEMQPPALLLAAEELGIAVLGVVDHSTARNAWAVMGAAEAFDVRALVGLEVESAEGVHILTLFDNAEAAMAMDAAIADHLPDLDNREDIFGEQRLLDEWGNTVGRDPRLLMAATDLPLERIAETAHGYGGISIPAHIDRSPNGLLPILGFVPADLRVDLLELSPHLGRSEAQERWPALADLPLTTASDAHYLGDIGRSTAWISWDTARAEVELTTWVRLVADELMRVDG
jgi:PHP family Zn ribbon phosphoesterase